jgi:hypothetical protein
MKREMGIPNEGNYYLTSSPANSNTLVMVTLFSFWELFCDSFTVGDSSFVFPLVMAAFEHFTELPVSFKKSKTNAHNLK